MIFDTKKTIGVWGLGVMGSSALSWLSKQGVCVVVYEQRALKEQEHTFINQAGAQLWQKDLTSFLDTMDIIVPSSGIDLRPYSAYKKKWLCELDLFASQWKKPILAITGSVGKTTVTHLLSQALSNNGVAVAMGGNIGVGLFDLLALQDTSEMAVIELSSFQLELCKNFAPDLAIITNIYPNHLDRHGTLPEYTQAKIAIIAHQKPHQKALLPLSLCEQLPQVIHQRYYFSESNASLKKASGHFFLCDDRIIFKKERLDVTISSKLSDKTYTENVLILSAALTLLGQPLDGLHQALNDFEVLDHRLEYCGIIKGIEMYNDSKSTLAPATMAAVQKLTGKPIILFLGGLSKGVDRKSLVAHLVGKVKEIYCFGKEAEQLHAWCLEFGIPTHCNPTLDEAFNKAILQASAGDQLLFSPGGTSFDLFADYKERGEYFKKLIKELEKC